MRLMLVLLGGGLGSLARYFTGLWLADRLGAAFPWGTLMVNVLGSFLIGLIATLADESGSIGPQARLLLVTGLLGGFTTFSAFSLETWRLLEQNEMGRAALNVAGTLALSFIAVALGVATGRALER